MTVFEAGTRLIQAITIDFHDTLFQCDEWFELEVRDLPVRFLSWLQRRRPDAIFQVDSAQINRLYRQMRLSAIDTGIEIDSIEGVERIMASLDLDIDRAEIARGVEELMSAALPTSCPRPGVIDLIQGLRATGLKLGVISNAIHHPFLEWALDRYELLADFDLVLSSARAGYYKSRIELYQLAMSELGVRPGEAIHIGDSYRFDVVGASAAGMRTVWLNLKNEPADGVLPDMTVQTLEGLAPILLDRFDVDSSQRPGQPHAV